MVLRVVKNMLIYQEEKQLWLSCYIRLPYSAKS